MNTIDDQSGEQTNESTDSVSREKIVRLSHLSADLESQVENQILEFEEQHETALLRGKSGVVPRITRWDYVLEGIIGMILTLYFVAEVFLV